MHTRHIAVVDGVEGQYADLQRLAGESGSGLGSSVNDALPHILERLLGHKGIHPIDWKRPHAQLSVIWITSGVFGTVSHCVLKSRYSYHVA
jgi:hypothetical protein